MPLQFNNDELLLIRKNSLERVRTQLRENFLGILDGSPPDFNSFITLAPSRSECADFFDDILIELTRTTCAKSITHDLRQPFRASIHMFMANWPKIITVNPSLVQPCVTLLECVVSNSSDDVAIWTAVYELLTVSARPVTPPAVTSAKSSAFDTPARPNSGSRLTESQTHELVDPYIRAEIQGNVYKDVLGFHIYFPGLDSSQWDCAVKCSSSCSETCQAQWDWSDETTATLDSWPAKPTETAAVQWFRKFNDRFIVHGPGLTRFYGSGARPLADSKCRRKCDIFLSQMLTNNNSTEVKPAANHQYSWYDVLVPGELKSNKDEDCTPDTVIELAGYAREVFGAQVGRRFVHAFTICGDVMRCYMFDRAGVSISQAFHINKNEKTFKLFVRIILCYATMGAAQFGFNTNYTTEHGEVFLPARQQPLPAFVAFKGQRFRLLEVLFYQPAIVSRGTLCWLARDEVTGEECVVKDAWRSKYRRSEGQFLDIAKRECAWGTVDCRLHGDVIVEGILDEITSNVRRGLDYISAKRVSISPKTLDRMLCLGNSETSHIGMQRMSRLNLQKSAANSSNTAKRQLPGYGPPNPKRLKLSGDGDENLEDDNEDMEGEDGDRVHTLLVFYTVGEDISKFISVRHLLEVFRDAIKCTFHAFSYICLNLTLSRPPVISGKRKDPTSRHINQQCADQQEPKEG